MVYFNSDTEIEMKFISGISVCESQSTLNVLTEVTIIVSNFLYFSLV
jgi:hypothetical protein